MSSWQAELGGVFMALVAIWSFCPKIAPCWPSWCFFFRAWPHFLPAELQTRWRICPLDGVFVVLFTTHSVASPRPAVFDFLVSGLLYSLRKGPQRTLVYWVLSIDTYHIKLKLRNLKILFHLISKPITHGNKLTLFK